MRPQHVLASALFLKGLARLISQSSSAFPPRYPQYKNGASQMPFLHQSIAEQAISTHSRAPEATSCTQKPNQGGGLSLMDFMSRQGTDAASAGQAHNSQFTVVPKPQRGQ